jgi:hypothetical protein
MIDIPLIEALLRELLRLEKEGNQTLTPEWENKRIAYAEYLKLSEEGALTVESAAESVADLRIVIAMDEEELSRIRNEE